MRVQDHIDVMKRRLAAIDRQRAVLDEEAEGLRRMIAAGEQAATDAATLGNVGASATSASASRIDGASLVIGGDGRTPRSSLRVGSA